MTTITLKGNAVETIGSLPAVGQTAPDFTLVTSALADITLSDYKGKRVVLNIFPSVDTPTCAMSVRTFNQQAASLDKTTVICVSADLPFALSRFCGAEGIDNVVTTSVFRNPAFGRDYGVLITTGALKGLLSRAVVVINEKGQVVHAEQVGEIANEPDYQAALAVLQ